MQTAWRSPGCAGVLSFFVTGLGQIYNGDVGLGVLAFFGEGLLCSLGIGLTPWFFILAIALWVWNIANAYRSALLYNDEDSRPNSRRAEAPQSSLDEYGKPPSADDIPTVRK